MRTIITFFSRIKGTVPLLKDSTIPFYKKLLVLFGYVYFFLPFDLLPIVLPGIGLLDDLALWIMITQLLKKDLDQYRGGPPTEPKKKRYKGKDIIYDVSYEVEKEEKKKK